MTNAISTARISAGTKRRESKVIGFMATSPSGPRDDDDLSENFLHAYGSVLGNRRAITSAGHLVDQFFADAATHLPDPAGRNRDHDPRRLADQILGQHVRRGLLLVEEPGKRVDAAAKHQTTDQPERRRGNRSEPVMR